MKAVEYWKIESNGKTYIYLLKEERIIDLDYLILSPRAIEELITELLNEED